MLDFDDDNQKPTGKTVLVLDDNPEWLAFASQQCKDIGFNVQTAADAFAAVGIMDQKNPDLLIFDFETPVGPKKTFLDCLGDDSVRRDIPSIVTCKNEDLNSLTKNHVIVAYYAYKSEQNWGRIETFIDELIDFDPITSNNCQL